MSAYRLTPGLPVAAEVRRVATEQVTRTLEDLRGEDQHEAIHEARKRCKKLRALLRLVRDSNPELYRDENAAIRDTARRMSGYRDHTAILEAFDATLAACKRRASSHADHTPDAFTPIREGLLEHRADATAPWDEQRCAVEQELADLQRRIGGWTTPGDGFEPLHGGLLRTYRRARRRMGDVAAAPSDAAIHEWRKRVKYHWHHLQLVRDAWRPLLRTEAKQAHRLSELLGDDRDLALLLIRLREEPEAFGGAELVGAFGGIVEARRAQLLHDAHILGARCFAERPDPFGERIASYWETAATT